MQKRWVLKSKSEHNKVIKLSDELGISTVLSELLIAREIETFDQARTFSDHL